MQLLTLKRRKPSLAAIVAVVAKLPVLRYAQFPLLWVVPQFGFMSDVSITGLLKALLSFKFHLCYIMCAQTIDANSSIWHLQSLRVVI